MPVTGPFDATPCMKASTGDLDEERMRRFVRDARRFRGFPLREESSPEELLAHLNLLDEGRPANAAVLLFGRSPQKFLISSEVKCAHFHGTEIAKPIPSYQVYKGTVFDMVDHAVDFVMSKINLRVGTRAGGTQAPVSYEIPREVVAEAIVNAVAHRDYTSNGSVQVMLFSDRLEVWNPGALPPSLTLEMLRRAHGSIPANPLLAEPLYLTGYIERMGTGTRDMIRRCREAGLPEPEFSQKDGFVVVFKRPDSNLQKNRITAEELEIHPGRGGESMSQGKTKNDYLAFPAIFETDPESGAVDFEFPDLENCFGNAPSLNEALVEAKEALENVLVRMEKDGFPIPEATPLDQLPSRKGMLSSLVVADMRAARRSWEERAVNRTVTLPGWLDQEARKANLNFSHVLQEGLKKRLRA